MTLRFLLVAVVVAVSSTAASSIAGPEGKFVSVWNASLTAAGSPTLIAADGLLLMSDVAAGWTTVDAFNETDGTFLWRWNSSRWTAGSPPTLLPFLSSKVPGVIFFIQMMGPTMVALDLNTGSVRWNYSSCVGACSYLPVVSDDGTTIFIDDQTRTAIRAIDIASGVPLWKFAVKFDYGFTAASCGSTATSCLAVLQAFNLSATLMFIDAQNGALLNATTATGVGAFRHGFSFPVTAGSVVTFLMGRSVLGYSCVDYGLLWNQTSAAGGFESVLAYPTGLAGWKTPSILLAAGGSLAMREAVSDRERWNVSVNDVCVDRIPHNFSCGWTPNVFGLLEPHAHALGVFAECSCWNRSNYSDGFVVSRFLALNVSNGALLWSHAGSNDPSAILPTADRTVTLLDEGFSDTHLRVYDSKTFHFLQSWAVPETKSLSFASSSRVFFLLEAAPNGGFTLAAFRRAQ